MSRHLSPALADVRGARVAYGGRQNATPLTVGSGTAMARLLDAARGLDPIRTAIAHPCNRNSLMWWSRLGMPA
jgi:hypothetical protein